MTDSDSASEPGAKPRSEFEVLSPEQTRSLLGVGRTRVRSGMKFGTYRLGKVLGRGGMGVVFEATARHLRHPVALKLMLQGELATAAELRLFQSEAEKTSMLRHPGIVQVLHVGRCRGYPYFTMPILRGGSLANALGAWEALPVAERPSFRERARLLALVARAVHHAHQHGLLHRDLKPGNILLDEQGKPLIADFGLASQIGEGESRAESQAGAGAGTVAYMSPEQVSLGARQLTVAADVYSLGAVLYQLLTFRVPFFGAEPAALKARIVSAEPVEPPRALDAEIPRDLESVCLRALEKERTRRYPSAAALAEDLECIAEGRPASIAPLSSWGRLWHWARRNPQSSARIAWSLGVAVAFTVAVLGWWQAVVRERQAALDTNAFIASGQAGAALFQLREYADRVQGGALEPEIAPLAEAQAVVLDPPDALKRLSHGFDSAFVLSKEGFVRAQWPLPPIDIWMRTYEFRDYFRAARELGLQQSRAVHVARAFRSERDNELKFGVSTPLYREGRWVGVLTAIIAADSVFGKVRMQEHGENARVAALLGPRDVERNDAESVREQGRFVFLIHDKLRHGQEVSAPSSSSVRAAFGEAAVSGQQFSLRYVAPQLDPDYRDPLSSFDGSYQAAFAPVGGTGYVVVVQTPAHTWGQRLHGFFQRLRGR